MHVSALNRSATQILSVLNPDATIFDLYSERGSDIYDAVTTGDDAEVREILHAVRETRGDILELACGSGRLTLPLARSGRAVTGLDASPRMLEILAAKVERAGIANVHPVLADMSAFALEASFGLIVLATTSVSLLTESQRRATFDRVRQHLAPDGVFLVSAHKTFPAVAETNTMVVPLRSDQAGVVLLSEELDPAGGFRNVSVIHVQRKGDELVTEAFASRVHLVDEPSLTRELNESGLVIRDVVGVRSATSSRDVSMIACSR